MADPAGFWQLGPLPPERLDGPDPAGSEAAGSDPAGTEIALDRVDRPDIAVDGRNLADVLRPVYRTITS